MKHLALLLDDFEIKIVHPSSRGFSWFSLIISGSGEEERKFPEVPLGSSWLEYCNTCL